MSDEDEVERLRRRVEALEYVVRRLADERHDKAIADGDHWHEDPFRTCSDSICATARGE